MTKFQVSVPFAASVVSLITMLGVLLLLVQMLSVQDFLLEQMVRTNDRVAIVRERVLDLRLNMLEKKAPAEEYAPEAAQ
jgi:hypothetical protein